MNQSPDTDQLMIALMQLHREYGVTLGKDSKGHKGTYASLPKVLESIHNGCANNGLVLTQRSIVINGMPGLESFLWHPASKQWISSQSILTPNVGNMSPDQAWGGSTTYHRRYDAMMLLGLFCSDDPTDNDGEVIPQKTSQKAQISPAKESIYISDNQVERILNATHGRKELRDELMKLLKINELKFIEKSKFDNILKWIDDQFNKLNGRV